MGYSPVYTSDPSFAFTRTPPQLVSPSASSASSISSPIAHSALDRRRPHRLPMTSHDSRAVFDMSAERNSESNQRRDVSLSSGGSRQQLPSLSSLFGPSSSSRPLNSPISERPGTYPATSPLDRPRLIPERNQQASYFPQAASPPVSQPRTSYDPERQQHTGAHPYSGTHSPRYAEANQPRPHSQSDAERSSRWASQHDASRSDYTSSRDATFRSPRHQFTLQFPGPRDHPGGYGNPTSRPDGPRAPPTPTSTVISDGVTSKDGLGPKIWTGTHFLPRFVRAAEVPGEGMCYFYDDGTHCKTVIDGEAVNAHWGVTKAGKPRKRLAIACVTCREKKIKCDPDFPRCVQCEKFGRVCRFKNAPRGGHNTSPSTPPAELDDTRRMGGSRANDLRFEGESGSPVSPGTMAYHESPETSAHKRLKLGPDAYISNGDVSSTMLRSLHHSKPTVIMQRPTPDSGRIPDEILVKAWRSDPYASDPPSIAAAVAHYFALTDGSMVLKFLPEQGFKTWLSSTTHRKSSEDLMLLYSLLAMSMTLSGGSKTLANEYAQVAHHAQKTTALNCLQLAQSRILLAMYYVSISRLCEANELMSAAAGTMACIQLNFELDKSREAGLPVYPFGMNKEGYTEARRRTFWSLYMLERLNGMFPDRLAFINAEDIYTRLPADQESFEQQLETHMPAFDPYELNIPNMAEQPTDIAPYVVEMVHIWANCQAGVYRLARRPINSDVETARVQGLAERVQEWQAALPGRFVFSSQNLEAASSTGNAGSFLMMHILFHHAMIKLSRHRQSASQLSQEDRAALYDRCCEHSVRIMEIARSLDRLMSLTPTVLRTPPPAMAAALTEAVDVLTGTGFVSRLHDLIDAVRLAKSIVDHIGSIWEGARKSKALIEDRLQKMDQILARGSRPCSPVNGYRVITDESHDRRSLRWEFADPFEKLYSRSTDIVYLSLD